MSHILPQILVPLTIGSICLVMLLTASLAVERVARNRRERSALVQRRAYGEFLADGDADEVELIGLYAARGNPAARGDLVDALALTGWSTGPVFAGHAALLAAAARDVAHRDVTRRAVGAALLGVIGGDDARALLRRLISEDPDRELRLVAARSLRVIGDDGAAWVLIHGLRDDVMPAARILEQLGRPFAAHALLDAMHVAELRPVRADIAEALGLAGHLPAAVALGGLVRFGTERERVKACRALGRLGDAVVVPLLAKALADEAWVVRAQAATALGACGCPSAVAPLARALADRAWWVRANSGASLRRCGPAGIAALREVAAHHPDRFARDRADEALALEAAAGRRLAKVA